MPWGVLLDGAQKSLLRGSRPLHLQYTTMGTFCQVAMPISHSPPTETQDTRINYSCSKASTEGCTEVALRDHYIMPITSSQWVKMFWHKVGKKGLFYCLHNIIEKEYILWYNVEKMPKGDFFNGGQRTIFVRRKIRRI